MDLFLRFPGGKAKALTLSYDDGVIQDRRLIDMFDSHGIKATFHLNSGLFSTEDAAGHKRLSAAQAKELYGTSTHEVAVHTLTHPHLEQLTTEEAIREVLQDQHNLETLFGKAIKGMSYPFGTYSDALVEELKQSGIAYARTTRSTHDFRLPTDWLRLSATCRHREPDLMPLADRFISAAPNTDAEPLLFYLWGHSYEFDDHDNWHIIETFCETIGGRDDIWYATSIELHDYIEAFRALQYSADGASVYNPSAETLWYTCGASLRCVSAGETQKISSLA